MYKLERLKKKYFKNLIKLNEGSTLFNEKNEDFVQFYYECNFVQRFFIKSNVHLIKFNSHFCGFLWIECIKSYHYSIKCLYIDKSVNAVEACKYAFKALGFNGVFEYCVKDNELNNSLLDSIGFYKDEGTIEMLISIEDFKTPPSIDDITVEFMKKGTQEQLRCSLQNMIFENDSRIPLNIDDMYFDEAQEYYLEDGCLFFKYKDEYIGYGQLIDDSGKVIIVNFGIIPEFRGRGLGELFLNHLLYYGKSLGYSSIFLKVNSINIPALELYKKIGFNIINEFSIWKKDK